MNGLLEWIASCDQWMQIVSLVTGAVYIVMQVFQHRWMWYFGLMTAGAAMVVTLLNRDASGAWAPLWAQVALNGYFFTMDMLGIFSWRRIEEGAREARDGASAPLHLVRVTWRNWWLYGALTAVSTPLICFLLSLTNDPMPVWDGVSMSLSVVGQLMLNRSHLEQWYPWLAADVIVTGIFVVSGDWWMALLYLLYVISCIVGLVNWRRRGEYVL